MTSADRSVEKQPSLVPINRVASLEELDREFESRYGMEVLQTLKDSNLSQQQMVEELQRKHKLNGQSEAIERTYRLHQQEFARKETLLGTTWRYTKNTVGFAADVVTAPFRWTWESFKRRPVLTTAAIAALIIAALYFTPTLAPTAGEYGAALIESFKGVLGRLGLATPATGVDAVAAVPVTGVEGSEAAAQAAAEAFASPGEQMLQGQAFERAAEAATQAAESLPDLSQGAEQILQSGSNIPGAEAILKPEVMDPLQRGLQGLGPNP